MPRSAFSGNVAVSDMANPLHDTISCPAKGIITVEVSYPIFNYALDYPHTVAVPG